MKEKIVDYVSNHPNARRRDIAGALDIWLCDRTFLNTMGELIEAGILIEGEYRDMANMENYLTYTVTAEELCCYDGVVAICTGDYCDECDFCPDRL